MAILTRSASQNRIDAAGLARLTSLREPTCTGIWTLINWGGEPGWHDDDPQAIGECRFGRFERENVALGRGDAQARRRDNGHDNQGKPRPILFM